jgi:surface antigen
MAQLGGRGLIALAAPYRGRSVARLWRRARGSLSPLLVLALAFPAAGCSFSYQLGSLFGNDEAKPEYTGSIASKPIAAPSAADMPESDLAYARAAAVEVVARDGQTKSTPWENPRTGARGTVTPIATAYASDGTTCRDFLASYVRQGSEAWLQGAACRSDGKWVVRHLRPWKRT